MRSSTVARLALLLPLLAAGLGAAPSPSSAQQRGWQADDGRGDMRGGGGFQDAAPGAVEKGDLAPVMANDGSGLPFELWRGLTTDKIEELISKIEIPPRSPAIHAMWLRLITADTTPPAGSSANLRFAALRLEALYRSGLARAAAEEIAKHPPGSDPLLDMLAARNELAAGNADRACGMAKSAAKGIARMPRRLKGQAVMLMGYCAVLSGNAAGAGLAAELARNEGQEETPGLDALDAIAAGTKRRFNVAQQLSLLDYKLMEKAGDVAHAMVLEKGEPALLAALALDASTPINLGLPAAERAAKLNALSPEMLAAIYRTNASKETPDQLLGASRLSGSERRAALFKAADAERSPMRKTRLIRALIDEARRAGLEFQVMQALTPIAAAIQPQPEVSWFAETAIEIALIGGDYGLVRRWVATADDAGGRLDHWLALCDIADPNFDRRGAYLAALEPLAQSGRFQADALNRLVTVLDALNYLVPIPLWDIANRAQQSNAGFLPETGVLSQLQDAAQKKEFGRTVLLAMQSLGPNGAEGAHMIALGDSIRALKLAGLEADARRLGLEALFASWPRMSGGPGGN